jgi:S-(hydroxymethyl)glutathione dehydrogenase/alcohol dehydrogenase
MSSKLAFARHMGATHTLNARQVEPVPALRGLTGDGPDYVFDSVGSATAIPQALAAARPGGTAVVAGLHAAKIDVPISAGKLVLHNKRLLGSFAGSIQPGTDLPRLVELYRAGRLRLDDLITKRYVLDDLPAAFADMEAGTIARGVIVFDEQ